MFRFGIQKAMVCVLWAAGWALLGGSAHAQIDKRIAQRSIPSAEQVRTLNARSEMSVEEAARLTRRSEFSNAEMQKLTMRSEYSAQEIQALDNRSGPGPEQAAHLRRYTDVRGITVQVIASDRWLHMVWSRSVD